MRGAFVDPGGDLPRLKAAAEQAGVTIEKILLTHGHIDHCGSAGILAEELGVPIEGPHEDDLFWIDRLHEDGAQYGITGKPFTPDRWLVDGDEVDRRRVDLRRPPLPRPHARPRRLSPRRNRSSRWSATSCSRARSAAGTSRMGNQQQLIRSITERLWPMGDETAFVPGHGPMSTFGHERRDQSVRRGLRRSRRPDRLALAPHSL